MNNYDIKIMFSELESVNNYLNSEEQKEIQALINKTYIVDSICYNPQETERLHKKYLSSITKMRLKESEAINSFIEQFENLLIDHTNKLDYNNKEETEFKKDSYYNAVAAGLVNLCKEYGNGNIYNIFEKIPEEKLIIYVCLFVRFTIACQRKKRKR